MFDYPNLILSIKVNACDSLIRMRQSDVSASPKFTKNVFGNTQNFSSKFFNYGKNYPHAPAGFSYVQSGSMNVGFNETSINNAPAGMNVSSVFYPPNYSPLINSKYGLNSNQSFVSSASTASFVPIQVSVF